MRCPVPIADQVASLRASRLPELSTWECLRWRPANARGTIIRIFCGRKAPSPATSRKASPASLPPSCLAKCGTTLRNNPNSTHSLGSFRQNGCLVAVLQQTSISCAQREAQGGTVFGLGSVRSGVVLARPATTVIFLQHPMVAGLGNSTAPSGRDREAGAEGRLAGRVPSSFPVRTCFLATVCVGAYLCVNLRVRRTCDGPAFGVTTLAARTSGSEMEESLAGSDCSMAATRAARTRATNIWLSAIMIACS